MRKKYLIYLSLPIFLLLNSCKDEEEINPDNYEIPKIEFAIEDNLPADLNKIDNLPVVGVVFSKLGLKSVKMSLVVGNEVQAYKEVTSFFNNKSYSFAEKLDYSPEYKKIIIEAIDLADRSVSDTLSFEITPVKEAPVITFDPEKIIYDELDPQPMPNTKFVVNSHAGLKSLEMTLITKEGQSPWGFPVDFNDAPQEYEFDTFIDYKEGDIGLRVKVTDVYGQIKIETLPVEYKTIPAPVVILDIDTFIVEGAENVSVPLNIESVGGVSKIDFYAIEKTGETLITSIDYSGENNLDINPDIPFALTMTGLKVTVTDNIGKETSVTAKAIVGFSYLKSYVVGSHRYAGGISEYPGVYSLLSLNDMKGYSVDDVLGIQENNVDIKFYMFGGSAVPRVYAIDGGVNTKSNEFVGKNGTVNDFATANATRFLKLPADFDFENATVADIEAISPSLITSNGINPVAVGDVLAFKTGPTSTAGDGKIGIMILEATEVTSTNVKDQGTFTISIKLLNN